MPKDQRVELFISLAASIELESDRLMQQNGNASPLPTEQRKGSATKGIPKPPPSVRSNERQGRGQGPKRIGVVNPGTRLLPNTQTL